MKKIKHILKLLKTVLIINLFLLTTINCFAQIGINIYDYSELSNYFKNEFNLLNKKLTTKSSQPLILTLMDINNPIVKNFIDTNTKLNNQEQLATHYFPKFIVNNNTTSLCMIFYDSNHNIFYDYENNTSFSKEETIQYLTWHELGHCFSFHINNIREAKKDEAIADSFAISLAINNNNPNLALKIVESIKLLNNKDIHANGIYLQNFLSNIIENNTFRDKKNINEIFNIIYFYYQEQKLPN